MIIFRYFECAFLYFYPCKRYFLFNLINRFLLQNNMLFHISKPLILKYLIFLFLNIILFVSCTDEEEKIKPESGPMTESVYASVTIQPDSLYAAFASVGGIIDKNYVIEGDLVKKNDKLVQIINSAPKLNAENARLSLELAKENLGGNAAIINELKAELKAAKLKLSHDSINYFRQKNLWEKEIGTKNELDTRRLAYEVSQSNYKDLKNKLNRTKSQLQTQLRQAENNYETSVINTKDFAVTSKINGKVYAVLKNPGEIVTQQEPVAKIGSADVFIIEMLVDEVDIARVKTGQKVLITLDAYGFQVFEAKVTKIYPQKDLRSQTFKIEARFDKQPENLYPGLSGEANIVISRKERTLTIPYTYLTEDNKVQTDEGLVPVKTGHKNMDRVEILSGIDSNTYIYKPSGK